MAAYGTWLTDALSDYLSGETVKAMLVDDTYVADPDETSAPSGSEVTGTGYTVGGLDVTSLLDISYDSALDSPVIALTGDVDFGAITVTGIGGIVFYVDGGQPLWVDMFGPTDATATLVYTPPETPLRLKVGAL